MYNCNPRCSSVASYYNEIFVFLKVDRKKPLCDLLKRLKMTSCIGMIVVMFFLTHFFLLFNFSFQLEGTHIEPVLHDTRQDNKQQHQQQQQQQSKEQQ